ncbi:putative transport protein [Pseudolycoriella hygida]|uniref:Transport protein n=1 Tax=Pseudolycoriella hygida TaxID=35572 RepID=A0A9Q0N8J9_9DIPT|nr:putative transport protein [Pseudolycoriella hygida]
MIVIFWTTIIATILVALTLVSKILTPFFIAGIISYILQPVILVAVILPIIYQQITLLINKIPAYKNYLQTEIISVVTAQIQAVEPNIANQIKNLIDNLANSIFSLITGVANNIWHYTMATINMFLLLVLIPIIMFYFLRDWTKITNNINNLLPLKNKQKIKKILLAINDTLSAYIRGQLNVCLLLATYYSISLWIIGVDFSVLLGVLSVSYFALGMVDKLFYIAIIYLIGGIVEGYILTPKMIGDKIGLHPVWVIFGVLALGNLFGFIGIFFAVPLASIIKVLFLTAIEFYKSSRFYKT